MHIRNLLLPVLLVVFTPLLHASDSKRTAEYFLTTPADFEGKEVTLDVSFVKPVHWKSPSPGIAFFQALTIDRRDYKHGGTILVAIPSEDASQFAKRYGTDFEGRRESNTLRGTFVSAPGLRGHGGRYLIDTTGKIEELVKQNKLNVEEGSCPKPLHRPGRWQ